MTDTEESYRDESEIFIRTKFVAVCPSGVVRVDVPCCLTTSLAKKIQNRIKETLTQTRTTINTNLHNEKVIKYLNNTIEHMQSILKDVQNNKHHFDVAMTYMEMFEQCSRSSYYIGVKDTYDTLIFTIKNHIVLNQNAINQIEHNSPITDEYYFRLL